MHEQFAQIDLNLHTLYRELQSLCRQSATPLVQEAQQAGATSRPLWDAEVSADLDYVIDESNPLYDEESDNILATRQAIFCAIHNDGRHDDSVFDADEVTNWLDYQHPWMTHQSWLTHDLLEHSYGKVPPPSVEALLNTTEVWVEIRTVRTYVYDIQAGRFIAPKARA